MAVPEWVDEVLLAGPGGEVSLSLDGPVSRAALRAEVDTRAQRLTEAGLTAGGTVALRLPPSVEYVANLLAAWRLGAQVTLLDYRLTAYEVEAALVRVGAQLIVESDLPVSGGLRGFQPVRERIGRRDGRPAQTDHALIQLSSGSTGPSKVIGRTAEDLMAEIDRYTRIDGVPRPGERTVLLASMVHVLGLVGGLLYGLHARVRLDLPERLTASGILRTVAADVRPTTMIGVPAYLELLSGIEEPPALPQLVRLTTAGELVRPGVAELFCSRYSALLGNMYGMTEVGVIATDLYGKHRPAVEPAPGIEVRVEAGELSVARARSPYVGLVDETRWVDGWLRTKDAATIDDAGLVTIRGRLDSQVSVGGLKVDLTEVEQALVELPDVAEAVVGFDGSIEAYVVLVDGARIEDVETALGQRLAPFKLPKRWYPVPAMPRTATGKLVRDRAALREAAR
jgi:3-hydroxy-4-methylanthranilate adenylyltransferase